MHKKTWPIGPNQMPVTLRLRVLDFLKYSLVLEFVGASLIMAMDKNASIFEAPLGATIVSLPLVINYLLLLPFTSINEDKKRIVFWAVFGAYITNLAVATIALNIYGRNVFSTGSLGEGGGYWIIFTIGGAIRYSLIGAILGASFSAIYLFIKHQGRFR